MKIFSMNNSEKGTSAVEFALVLPLLLTLLFGTVEFGLLMYDKAVLTNACREGARFGILQAPRKTKEEIETVVNQYCASNLITFGAATTPGVSALYTSQNRGDDLTVTATYQYNFLFMDNVINSLIGGTNLSSRATMKYE
ncbi:MAG: TadE/TadG family type IV pilus assembly protein [Thermodesulfobacteriota bacterium]|nr:TadE/TadG family type IV pilus assembly protein [Thermodesulfobacteriota bacterium]